MAYSRDRDERRAQMLARLEYNVHPVFNDYAPQEDCDETEET
jgi:hypothetical protein